jgi:hypothetical protein
VLQVRLPRPPSVSAALLFGAIAGSIAAMAVPTNAFAAIYCNGHYFDNMSTISTHYGVGVNPTASTAYGMYAFNHAPQTCTYTSSVLVRKPPCR